MNIPDGGVFRNFSLESPYDFHNTEVRDFHGGSILGQGLEPKPQELVLGPKNLSNNRHWNRIQIFSNEKYQVLLKLLILI